MTPTEQADELVAEATRIRDTHDGCHSLPSLLHDLKVHRKTMRADNTATTLEWMEFIVETMRRRVGWQKVSQAESLAPSSCVSRADTQQNDGITKSRLV